MLSRLVVDRRPLVVHVVFRFDTGGLENGVVNLINHMPPDAYRHAVVALTEVTDFRHRIGRTDVECIALHKPPGHGLPHYAAWWRLLRHLQPAIVHTRNLAALEMQLPAWAARVPVRIHGEHGRDASDPDGIRRRYQWLRRAHRPFVDHHVALSGELADYLLCQVGISQRRVSQICNGVDTARFSPALERRAPIAGSPFTDPRLWLIGTVGRMLTVKAQPLLAQAFVRMLALRPGLADNVRLVMVGDGPLRSEAQAVLEAAGVAHLAWLPGGRSDVPEVMRGLDCFALPSLAEGISNTILEAMASALPVVATDVGGNADLVAVGETGEIVPAANVEAMAHALLGMALAPTQAAAMGRAGRQRVQAQFSLPAMVAAYRGLYDRLLAGRQSARG